MTRTTQFSAFLLSSIGDALAGSRQTFHANYCPNAGSDARNSPLDPSSFSLRGCNGMLQYMYSTTTQHTDAPSRSFGSPLASQRNISITLHSYGLRREEGTSLSRRVCHLRRPKRIQKMAEGRRGKGGEALSVHARNNLPISQVVKGRTCSVLLP